ncbi:MAG: DEAD/DEAH box helicase family protein, partial [Leptospiraceae bacterium]|nr:DEAD/DEAH box helicase family protein [Leptospiraceae bacterium]
MFAEILFPGHNLPLTYRIPEKLRKQILLYTRVQALLKEKKETGLLVGLHETQENTSYQILDILRVIDKSPIINSTQIRLAEKIKENYLCTLGDALFQMIPSGSRETFIEDKWVQPDSSEQLFSLKPNQQKVIQDILEVVSKKSVSTHLLQGITGSGKTRVYLELVNYYLEAGYTVLYLVPEISLVLNFAVQFKNLFQDRISILHSGMKGS